MQKQTKEPLMMYTIPTLPRIMIGKDLFTLHGQQLLTSSLLTVLVTIRSYIDILLDILSNTEVACTKSPFAK